MTSGGEGGREATRIAARSSLVDSIKGCGLTGMRIDKEELKRRVIMPRYLRLAVVRAIREKNASAAAAAAAASDGDGDEVVACPDAPVVVFVNSKSGGHHGPVLKQRLQELMSEEQVFDLSAVEPPEFFVYGLTCLERVAQGGDNCAKEVREKLRIMVAGGDGTVGWVLRTVYHLYDQNRMPIPPVGIIPLGTGNDLSRSFGWGGSFPFAWRSAVKQSLNTAVNGPVYHLDSWKLVVSMPAEETRNLPYCLKKTEESLLLQDAEFEGSLAEKLSCYEGVFYNYFSIDMVNFCLHGLKACTLRDIIEYLPGMDAQVAYSFHHLRNKKPYLAQGPISNKLIYSVYGCTQGWFCTPCLSSPDLRGLNNIIRLHIKKAECSDWELIRIPPSVRGLVALNLHSYGSGRNPWGHPKTKYLEKKGFVEAHVDDGLLEIFGFKHGWHTSFVMVDLITAIHIAQAAAIRLEIRGSQRKETYMQMDGEPWKQQIIGDYSTFVEIKKVPLPTLMISGK